MSSHLFPEVSAHLLALTPTAHWLEYVDWAASILEEPLRIEKGAAVLPSVWIIRYRRRRRIIAAGCCAVCGYDLRATTGRCPECGAGAEQSGSSAA